MPGQPEVREDLPDEGRVGEEGDDAHLAVAGGRPTGAHLIDPGQEHSSKDSTRRLG